MKNVLLILVLFFAVGLQASGLEEVWKVMEKQDYTQARKLLEKAVKNKDSRAEASMVLMMLNGMEAKDGNMDLMKNAMGTMEDPSPYLFSVWFEDAVTSGYGKKEQDRLKFLNTFYNNDKINGSIKSGLYYIMGMHSLYSNNMPEAIKSWKQAGAIKSFQFVGPFDNTSGSGFDKEYEPVKKPKADAVFKSKTNADIHWFVPQDAQQDPWVTTSFYIRSDQGVVYAQTFVESPEDQEAIMAIGLSGSFKAWLNDVPVLEEEMEYATELDLFQRKVKLNKGTNRFLIQLGYTNTTQQPNFSLRFLDEQLNSISNITASEKYSEYKKGAEPIGEPIQHFAEAFFENKIEKDPKNILNHLLLAKTFIRSQKQNEAIKVLKKGLEIYPNNMFLHHQLLESYGNIKDRTEILKQIDHIRNLNEDQLLIQMFDFEIEYGKENWTACDKLMPDFKKAYGADSETYYDYEIKMLAARKEYKEMMELIEKAYDKYPENTGLVGYKYSIVKNVSKSASEPPAILEKFLEKNYDYRLLMTLIEEYFKQGNKNKAEKLMLAKLNDFPEESEYLDLLINFYTKTEDYKEALVYINRGIANVPFSSGYWSDRAYVYESMKKKDKAIDDYEKALHYNPNLFSAREKIRLLSGKKPLLSYFQKDDVYKIIEKELKKEAKSDNNYKYIFKERNYAIFEGGASMEHSYYAIRILNESGIDHWKEASIGVNGRQRLTVENAEVVKQNGQKIMAERSYNQLVFPSLEVGDAVFIEYRLENFTGGKLSKEFWYDYVFNDYVPVDNSVFRMFTKKDVDFKLDKTNFNMPPKEYNADEFKVYEWTMTNIEACKDESYMPSIYEVGQALQLSSVQSWKVISDWYSDLALPRAKEDYNLNEVYDEIFEGKNLSSDYQKAEAIYSYICENIRYSSVSFRQSNFIPQKPMVTISTQLGDCKDVSTLFHTLANKAGLKTHLVLVNTRDNGEETLKVPSIDFNHCIIKIDLPDGEMFQELTDSKLPFGALPVTIANAQALVIPNSETDPVGEKLIHLPTKSKLKNEIKRKVNIKVEGESNIRISTELIVSGEIASDYRHYFSGLTKDETREQVQYLISSSFDNNVELKNYSFEELETRSPTFVFKVDFLVEDAVVPIGGLSAVKPTFFENIVSLDRFPDEDRQHPVVYWLYESSENYDTEITMELPQGKKILDLPETIKIDKEFLKYELSVEKLSESKIKIKRNVSPNLTNIPPSSYADFRKAIKQITKAEDMYIAYK